MPENNTPAVPAPAPSPVTQPAPTPEEKPVLKDDLVALAIDRGVPSYEAWAKTVPELKKMLEV